MKWLHNLLKGMSLTAALFVFQACYGTPPGYPDEWEDEESIEAPAVAQDEMAAPEELAMPEESETEVVE